MRTLPALAAAALIAACGSGSETISIQGDFASPQNAPGRVYALEARTDAEVREGTFEIEGLATSPISLRMVQNGDTVGHLDVADVPPGARVVLHGLRTDPRTGRAFPSTVEISGAPAVRVNGIRMMNADALPARVDADGTVLAASPDRVALLVRPVGDQLPDLRVVITPTTAIATRDSLAADLRSLSVGDSVHVRGSAERGFVVADHLTLLLAAPASTVSSAGLVAGEDEGGEARAATRASVSAPAVRTVRREAERHRERGRGEGRGRGGGNGKGRGKEKN